MPMVAKPLSLQGVNIPDPRKTYTLAEAVEAAVAREKALKQRREMTISVPTAVTTTPPDVSDRDGGGRDLVVVSAPGSGRPRGALARSFPPD